VGACGPIARRLPAVEARLADASADAGLAERILTAEVAAALDPIDDLRASASYRVEAAVLLLRRAALALVE
jgi:CO/xanthine dehydrogenase FAD-binding subunit